MTHSETDLVDVPCTFIITRAGEELGLGKEGEYPTVAKMSKKAAVSFTRQPVAEVRS